MTLKVKSPKTESEILEANKIEAEIEERYTEKHKAAVLEFQEATEEEFAIYKAVWTPARERWEKFAAPHFKKMFGRERVNEKIRDDNLVEIRSNWKECPQCGTAAARYQMFCSKEKCGFNFLIAKL